MTATDERLLAQVSGMFDAIDPAPPVDTRALAEAAAYRAVLVTGCADLAALTQAPAAPGVARESAEEAQTPRAYTIQIPPRTILLNANDRPHHMKRARIVRNLRDITRQLAVIRRLPHLERVEIIGFVHPPDSRRRDPHNWYPTLKACIDGTVDAGVISDDDATRLVRTDMQLGAKTRPLSFSLLIREVL